MGFTSILFPDGAEAVSISWELPEPEYFADLNLDQIVRGCTLGREEYHLTPFFYLPLQNGDTVRFRQEVMRDLEESEPLRQSIQVFAQKMQKVRIYRSLAEKLYYKLNKEGWFLEAVDTYCDAVFQLAEELLLLSPSSCGFLAFREYLSRYVQSPSFVALREGAKDLKKTLKSIRYCIQIDGLRVKVRHYEEGADYSAVIETTFARFRQEVSRDYRVQYRTGVDMNHVEAKIAEGVARLFPEVFSSLERYCAENACFLDEKVVAFDREIQFYMAYLEYIAPLKRRGLQFCYPEISPNPEGIYGYEVFDLALAHSLLAGGKTPVCNDFFLQGQERIFLVSGPNQSGKTTFARTFGQLHYLASLGFPVPGSSVRLLLPDRIFTHFEREEDITTLRGKLEDDLVRTHAMLTQATPKSILIINEAFNSTALRDAIFLSTEIMKKILQLGAICVWVTFVVELAFLDAERIVSLVSTVYPDNPEIRTYKILRKIPDGLAFALSLARKHRLTREAIKERIRT